MLFLQRCSRAHSGIQKSNNNLLIIIICTWNIIAVTFRYFKKPLAITTHRYRVATFISIYIILDIKIEHKIRRPITFVFSWDQSEARIQGVIWELGTAIRHHLTCTCLQPCRLQLDASPTVYKWCTIVHWIYVSPFTWHCFRTSALR